jgi:hypothetical protein
MHTQHHKPPKEPCSATTQINTLPVIPKPGPSFNVKQSDHPRGTDWVQEVNGCKWKPRRNVGGREYGQGGEGKDHLNKGLHSHQEHAHRHCKKQRCYSWLNSLPRELFGKHIESLLSRQVHLTCGRRGCFILQLATKKTNSFNDFLLEGEHVADQPCRKRTLRVLIQALI